MIHKRLNEQCVSSPYLNMPKRARFNELDTVQNNAATFLDVHGLFNNGTATATGYDFVDIASPHIQQIPDGTDPNAYPFCDFIGNGNVESDGAVVDSHFSSNISPPQVAFPTSDVSSTVPSFAGSGDRDTTLPMSIQSSISHPKGIQSQPKASLAESAPYTRKQACTNRRAQHNESQENQLSNTDASNKRSLKISRHQEATSTDQNSDTTAVEESESFRRQADRAARNRESSRRAREKAKGRLKSLESYVKTLEEQCRNYRMQLEALSQQGRAACGYCGYSAVDGPANIASTHLTQGNLYSAHR